MVLFRTESGQAVVFDAHCPHLGADLGFGGKVVGESIQCPFHAWRFGTDGTCLEVPECDRIPPKAKAQAWATREQNGMILAWYHPDGVAPTFDIPGCPDDGWTPVKSIVWRIRSHPQEVGENTVDTAHMRPVHRTEPSRVRSGPDLKGPVMELSLAFLAPGELVGMDGDNDVQLDIEMYGLGQIQVTSHVLNAGITARYWVNSTPIDRENIDIHGVVSVQYGDDQAFTEEVAELFYEAFTTDFVKDFPIWENKLYRRRPVLSAADGPIGVYRKWAKQFYLDAAPAGTTRQVRAPTAKPKGRVAGALVSVKGLLSRVRAAVPRRRGRNQSATETDGTNGVGGTGEASATSRSRVSATISKLAPAAPKLQVDSATHYRETLASRFVATAATGVDAVFQWELSGDDAQTFHAVVQDGAVTVVEGSHPTPTVTLAMAADDYVKVVNGELDGTKAFTSGKGKVSGKIRLAMKMRKIFPQ